MMPSFVKVSQRASELLSGHEIMTDGRTNRQTDGQGDYNSASVNFLIIHILIKSFVHDCQFMVPRTTRMDMNLVSYEDEENS